MGVRLTAGALLAANLAAFNTARGAEPTNELSLEEIVVTSDRHSSYSADLVQAGSFRGARQLDTPLTVAVVPLEVIESQQAHGIYDALRNTAGVTSSQTSPTVYNNIAIRGIAVDNRANYRSRQRHCHPNLQRPADREYANPAVLDCRGVPADRPAPRTCAHCGDLLHG